MKNYKIEGQDGDFDFYSCLNDGDDDSNVILDNNNNADHQMCLITQQPLVDKFVKLNCGHNFNYIPLFNDLVNHKKKFNMMESNSGFLKKDEIRCPYCRQKQTGYLPYYSDMSLPKVDGVNWMEPTINFNTAGSNKCGYLVNNELFNSSLPECNETNIKYIKCGCYGHYKLSFFENDIQDDNYYCYNHKTIIMKKYNLEIKNKKKEEAKALKLKAKEEIKKAKEELKQKEKFDKLKLKFLSKLGENVVLSSVLDGGDNNNTALCSEILKSGTHKGEKCCVKIFEGQLCKRHYNLKNKI
jgi:hypothetical protein